MIDEANGYGSAFLVIGQRAVDLGRRRSAALRSSCLINDPVASPRKIKYCRSSVRSAPRMIWTRAANPSTPACSTWKPEVALEPSSLRAKCRPHVVFIGSSRAKEGARSAGRVGTSAQPCKNAASVSKENAQEKEVGAIVIVGHRLDRVCDIKPSAVPICNCVAATSPQLVIWNHCWHYEIMTIQINIRDVPERVRDELAARAALQGKSMQEFLRAELERLASRPSMAAWLQQVRKRKRATRTRVSSKKILESRNSDRR